MAEDKCLDFGAARTWRYKTWAGRVQKVTAASVTFEPAHVVWRDAAGAVVLAEANQNVTELTQDGATGESTRGGH